MSELARSSRTAKCGLRLLSTQSIVTCIECQPGARRPAPAARACWSASAPSDVGGPDPHRVLARRSPATGRTTAARCRWRPSGAASPAAHGPSSTCTSTLLIPRCCAHATPATVTAPALRSAPSRGRVDPRLGLDRRLRGPAARHPVGVEVGEPGQLDLGDPLAGGHVAVQAGHHHPHREAVLDRQRLAVHPDREQRVPAVAQHRGRACRRSSRPPSAAPPGRRRAADRASSSSVLDRRAEPAARCRSGRRRPRWTRRPASRTARSSGVAAARPR